MVSFVPFYILFYLQCGTFLTLTGTTDEARNSLLDLQKRFYDDVLVKLSECRRREESVDHDNLIATIEDIHRKISTIYQNLAAVHDKEMKANGAE